MKERGINLRRNIVFLLLSYLITAEKAELRSTTTTGAPGLDSGLARIELNSKNLSVKRAFFDTIESDETPKSRRSPSGARSRVVRAESYQATDEEKTNSSDTYKAEFIYLPPGPQAVMKATDAADIKWVEANHAKKSNKASPDESEFENARKKEHEILKRLFESTTDHDKLTRYLKAYEKLRKGEPWPHQYDNANRYPKEIGDYLAHRKEELTFVQVLRDLAKAQSSPEAQAKAQAEASKGGQEEGHWSKQKSKEVSKGKDSGSGASIAIIVIVLILIGVGIYVYIKRDKVCPCLKKKPAEGEKQGLLPDQGEPGDEKAGKKGEKGKGTEDGDDAGKKGKDKKPGAKEDGQFDDDEETLNIVTTDEGGGPKSPGQKFPDGTPRGKKRGILPKIFGKKDKSPSPGRGDAKKPKGLGALLGRGKDKGSPPPGKGTSKPSLPGKKGALVPPGVTKSTRIPRI